MLVMASICYLMNRCGHFSSLIIQNKMSCALYVCVLTLLVRRCFHLISDGKCHKSCINNKKVELKLPDESHCIVTIATFEILRIFHAAN